MKRPISISNIPNIEKDDIKLYLKLLFNFSLYKKGNFEEKLKNWFIDYFRVEFVFNFITGRLALFEILKSLNLNNEDEIILQAFTCSVVPEAIIAAKLKPVYVDIDKTFNIDVNNLKNKITKKTKVIIIQHTFGIPAEIEKIKEIAKKNNIIIIEDCAHNIGSKYKNKLLGTFSDIAFFSFGRSKAFSATNGGIIITNNKNLAKKLEIIEKSINYPSNSRIFKELLHPIIFYFLINPLYDFLNIGKLLLIILQKIKILTFEVSKKEKEGFFEFKNIYKMPNLFCFLALNQLSKIDKYNNRRKETVKKYLKNDKILQLSSLENFAQSDIEKYFNPLLRFPLLVKNSNELIKKRRKGKIYLGDWYSNVVDPKGVNLEKIYYQKGSCPNAEKISKQIVNLPTNPTLKDNEIEKIIKFVKINI